MQHRPDDMPHDPPAPRRRAELDAIPPAASTDGGTDPVRIVFVAGPKDHGPGQHDYPHIQRVWSELLARAEGVQTDTAFGWPTPQQWQRADVAFLYFWNHDWTDRQYADLDALLDRGGGVVAVHAAIIEDREPARLAKRFGLAGQRPTMQYRHGPLSLDFHDGQQHPITAGFNRLDLVDEAYWAFSGDESQVEVLATSMEEGRVRPLAWTYQPSGGRVFCTALGHFTWTFDNPLFRLVLLRGIAWAARQPVDRFRTLATAGVTLADG